MNRFCAIAVLCGLAVALAFAQANQPPAKPAPPLAQLQREFKSLPFKPGEKLIYEVRYTRFPIAAKVGEVTFEYVGEAEPPGIAAADEPFFKQLDLTFQPQPQERYFRLRGSAVSKGILTALFGIDVANRYETLVDRQDFSARLHWREVNQNKKHEAQAVLFEREPAGITYKSVDLNKPQADIKTKPLPRAEGMLDLISAFYFVRLQKLKEGEMLRFPVSDDGVNYVFDVVVGKKEKLNTDCGKVNTLRIEPKLFGPGQLISRPGEMTLWLTADKTRVPVKLIAKTSAGTVSARLLNFKNNCAIVEPGKDELEPPVKPGVTR